MADFLQTLQEVCRVICQNGQWSHRKKISLRGSISILERFRTFFADLPSCQGLYSGHIKLCICRHSCITIWAIPWIVFFLIVSINEGWIFVQKSYHACPSTFVSVGKACANRRVSSFWCEMYISSIEMGRVGKLCTQSGISDKTIERLHGTL